MLTDGSVLGLGKLFRCSQLFRSLVKKSSKNLGRKELFLISVIITKILRLNNRLQKQHIEKHYVMVFID